VHSQGYTAAKIFARVVRKSSVTADSSTTDAQQPTVTFKIRLTESGELVDVDGECLEKANPANSLLDPASCGHMWRLRFINESSLCHAIRQRALGLGLHAAYVNGHTMTALRPLAPLTDTIASDPVHTLDACVRVLRSARVVATSRDTLSPHVYAFVHDAYQRMLLTRHDQSVLLMGHSGAGKTWHCKQALAYLFRIADVGGGSGSSFFTQAKLDATFRLLAAFTSIATWRTPLANRHANLFLLEFNAAGRLVAILLQTIAFDQVKFPFNKTKGSNSI
jgi:myosin heavy subunit